MRELSIKEMGYQPAQALLFVMISGDTIRLLRTEILACPFCGKGVLSLIKAEKIFDDVSGGRKEVGKTIRYGCTDCDALFAKNQLWLSID